MMGRSPVRRILDHGRDLLSRRAGHAGATENARRAAVASSRARVQRQEVEIFLDRHRRRRGTPAVPPSDRIAPARARQDGQRLA